MSNTVLVTDTVSKPIVSVWTPFLDFVSLLKPRVMSLVIFTTISGMYLAPSQIHPVLSFFSILAIALGAGSAGAINQWIDKDIDKLMERTKKRPIASDKISIKRSLIINSV